MISNSPAFHRLTVLVLLALGATAAAGADLPPTPESLAERCAGPASSLLPECAAWRQPINGKDVRGLGSTAAAEAKESSEPAAQPQPPAGGQPASRPPEPAAAAPTEFQRFVSASVGEVLPIYGAALFEDVPTTFAPLDRVPVTSDYVVGPGDEILLRVWGQVNVERAVMVDRAGAIYIPQVGNVNVSGLEFQQLPGYLRTRMERVWRNFDLNVNMGQLRSIQVFVVGHARRPGAYTVSSLSTLVNALFASGGPSPEGSVRRIQLKRGASVVTEFDLYDLLLNGDKSNDVRLLPGDVVYIPPAGDQIAISGSVKSAAIFELKGEATVANALRLAGGLAATADARHATLERIRERTGRELLDIELTGAGLRTQLRDGDLLRVRAVSPGFANVVTLRGNVANPGRFAWRPGMRIRELIPGKEALLTRHYWTSRNSLGFVRHSETVGPDPAQPARDQLPKTRVEMSVPEVNWSYAVVERLNPRDLTAELLPFHLGRLILDGDDTQNLELRAGDVVTIFSQRDIRVPVAQQTRLVRLEGELNAAGVYVAQPGETLGQLIARSGGLTREAYLFGAELIRESTKEDQERRLEQFVHELEAEVERTAAASVAKSLDDSDGADLEQRLAADRRVVNRMRSVKPTGRVVLRLEPDRHDLSKLMSIQLEAGDRFSVGPRPATVNVMGAVYNQNSFVYEANATVSDYLQQSGGVLRSADEDRIFIIRADGSVLPKQDPRFGAFKKKFAELRLHPGDSIVVPERLLKGSLLRSVRDWSQVFAQFGLGAAAINVLR